jgi:hypothetical protein
VFDHLPISWEWAIVVSCIIVQILIAESWKWAKRGKLGDMLAVKQPDVREPSSVQLAVPV